MRLSELAFACYIYDQMSDYDSSYSRFLQATKHAPDLRIAKHRIELLKWLNAWGCRQFAKHYYDLASDEIGAWYEEASALLPSPDKALLELSDADLDAASTAYGRLAKRTACRRKRNGASFDVTVGPTGAAKVLFALRPSALIPWDDPIRNRLKLDGSARSYSAYLRRVKAELEELSEACDRNGYNLSDLPRLIGRSASSIAKLVDEYFWVTITRECPAPTNEVLARWASWE